MRVNKIFTNVSKGVDVENRLAEYIISSESIDRYGEIVEQSWDLENYNKNPIVLWGHDPSEADNVLGKCVELRVEGEEGERYTVAKVKFADEGTSEKADTVWKLVKQGILKTVSVGFVAKDVEERDIDGRKVPVLKNNELLEFSIVAIPANPNAVALAYSKGEISKKDVDFLAEGSKKDICGIIKEEKNEVKNKNAEVEVEKGMNEEDLKKIAEIVEEKINTAIEPIKAELEAIKAEKEVAVEEEDEGKEEEVDEDGEWIEGDDMLEELDEEEEKEYIKALEEEYKKLSEEN